MIIFDHGDHIVHMGKTIAQKGAHVVKDGIRRKTAVGDTTKAYLFFFQNALFPFHFGGLGVRQCSPKVAFLVATVGNRRQPSATVGNRPRDRCKALHSGECCRKGS